MDLNVTEIIQKDRFRSLLLGTAIECVVIQNENDLNNLINYANTIRVMSGTVGTIIDLKTYDEKSYIIACVHLMKFLQKHIIAEKFIESLIRPDLNLLNDDGIQRLLGAAEWDYGIITNLLGYTSHYPKYSIVHKRISYIAKLGERNVIKSLQSYLGSQNTKDMVFDLIINKWTDVPDNIMEMFFYKGIIVPEDIQIEVLNQNIVLNMKYISNPTNDTIKYYILNSPECNIDHIKINKMDLIEYFIEFPGEFALLNMKTNSLKSTS